MSIVSSQSPLFHLSPFRHNLYHPVTTITHVQHNLLLNGFLVYHILLYSFGYILYHFICILIVTYFYCYVFFIVM
jgi:hypothetical protein